MSEKIRSKIFNRGDKNEASSDVISDYGNGKRGRFVYCKATQSVLPIAEARRLDGEAEYRTKANAAHGVISNDIMEPTQHPIDGKYYTSQSKFREVTKAHGFDEVGNDYDNGYRPEKELERQDREYRQNLSKEFKDRLRENAPVDPRILERFRQGTRS